MKELTVSQEPDYGLVPVLQKSLYPNAGDESVRMIIDYCVHAKLDPLQKPVHIVPMWDSSTRAMRDVVMPGIGLYRIQAARTGEYAGISEPEFSEEVKESIGGQPTTYPKWCKVTVKRMVSGVIVEFTAQEFWKENYAVKGGKERSIAPNAMWSKRPYGQIAKCAEAQALRKAFPEIGAQPTAEEMEGSAIEAGFATTDEKLSTGHAKDSRYGLYAVDGVEIEPELPSYPPERFEENLPKWVEAIRAGKKTADKVIATIGAKYALSEDQKQEIRDQQ